jgi:hypothetical protein
MARAARAARAASAAPAGRGHLLGPGGLCGLRRLGLDDLRHPGGLGGAGADERLEQVLEVAGDGLHLLEGAGLLQALGVHEPLAEHVHHHPRVLAARLLGGLDELGVHLAEGHQLPAEAAAQLGVPEPRLAVALHRLSPLGLLPAQPLDLLGPQVGARLDLHRGGAAGGDLAGLHRQAAVEVQLEGHLDGLVAAAGAHQLVEHHLAQQVVLPDVPRLALDHRDAHQRLLVVGGVEDLPGAAGQRAVLAQQRAREPEGDADPQGAGDDVHQHRRGLVPGDEVVGVERGARATPRRERCVEGLMPKRARPLADDRTRDMPPTRMTWVIASEDLPSSSVRSTHRMQRSTSGDQGLELPPRQLRLERDGAEAAPMEVESEASVVTESERLRSRRGPGCCRTSDP